jgi:hypothetical protein
MKRYLFAFALIGSLTLAAPASAQQTLGTFRWNVAPFCNVLHLTVTQFGSMYALHGFEEQCGGNPRLPVYGVAFQQGDGTIWFGLTTIFPFGNGLHTQVTMFSNLSGNWRDNANQTGTWVFSPGATTGGPRINPIVPDQRSESSSVSSSTGTSARDIDALKAEVAELKQRLAELLARSR